MNRPGPATPQHRSSTETPGAMPARSARARISPARMKLSCSTNSPGGYADTRARLEGLVEREHARPASRPLAARRPRRQDVSPRGKAWPWTSVMIGMDPKQRSRRPRSRRRSAHDANGSDRPGDRSDRPGAADRRARGHRRPQRRRPQPRRLGRRSRLRSDHERGAGARALLLPRRPARPGRLGDPRPGHARRRRRGAGRGLVRPARAGRAAGVTRGGRARAGRGRRMGRAAHADHGDAGRALRRRGRRVPDPRPQRVRRPLGRRLGARDRRGTLRVSRRRMAAAVAA